MCGDSIHLRLDFSVSIHSIHSIYLFLLLFCPWKSQILSLEVPITVDDSIIGETFFSVCDSVQMRSHSTLELRWFVNAVVDVNLIMAKSGRTSVMDSGTPHISREFGLSFKFGGSVHDGTIIPNDQISRVLPGDMQDIFRLSGVVNELPDQFKSFLLIHSNDVAGVGGNVHGLRSVGVDLHHIVDGTRFCLCFVIAGGVSWSGEISRVPERVSALTSSDLVLLLLREILVRCADVGEMCISGSVLGEDVSEQKGIGCSSRVEGGVDMPQRVSLNNQTCLKRF